ncbi:MAG TPA: ABC transporter permease, partial [Terriglobales bacterium]|nr:ABC transporter permease [Terriglobales bacterium]
VQFLVQPNATVYLFALLISVGTGFLFGCMPVRQIWTTDPNHVLRAGAGIGVVPGRFALRDILLGAQIALCCLLVTACFVSVRGLQRTLRMPLGFDPQDVALTNFDLHLADYADAQVPQLQQRLLESIAHLPGVTAAAFSSTVPLALDQSSTSVFTADQTRFNASRQEFNASYYQVSPGYLAAAGTRLLSGREFSWHDDQSSQKVAIVNAIFARKLFGTENAVGKLFRSHGEKPWEVVGVVEDGKYETMAEDPRPAIFYPILQSPNTSTTFLVRSSVPSAQIIPAIHGAIMQIDRSIPIFALNSWQDSLGFAMLPSVAATLALTVFGSLAIILAVTGLFGMASYTVSKRLRELGIRVALGAQQGQVLKAALSRTGALLAIGSVVGLFLGAAASRVLASIVYHASASDPIVLLGVAVTMTFVGLLSASIPARRTLAIQPMDLLREE